MGHYEEQITVRCSIKFKIPEGFDVENENILPEGVKYWDDYVVDENANTIYGEFTYKTYADCWYDAGDYWTPPTDVIQDFEEKKIGLRQDLIISETHHIQ